MQQNYPFQPRGAQGTTPTAQTAASITAAVTQLTLPPIPAEGCSALIAVDGAANVAWSFGTSSGLTISNGVFMFANSKEIFSIPGGVTTISLIGASAAGTLRVVVGDGM
jgi:hypothetical protein